MQRSRRAVLAMVGSGLLAGCGGTGSTTTTQQRTDATPTTTQATTTATENTPTPTPTDAGGSGGGDTGAPAGVPTDRFYLAGAMRDDHLAARLVGRETIPELRHWDSYQHRLETIQPKRDRFLKLSVLFVNQGGSQKGLQVPDTGEMRAWAGDTTVGRMTSLYEDVAKSAVRIPISADFSMADVTLGYSTRPLNPGSGLTLSFLFDVPAHDTYLVEWNPERTVEGHSQPVYLGLRESK